MFPDKEEMYGYIEKNIGYIFDNPQKYLKFADSEAGEINPLDYAIGFVHGVVNSSGFDLDEVEEDLKQYNYSFNIALGLIKWWI